MGVNMFFMREEYNNCSQRVDCRGKWPQHSASPIKREPVSPALESGLGHVTAFDHWDLSKCDTSRKSGAFPGGPVVKTPRFHCRGRRFDPWLGS